MNRDHFPHLFLNPLRADLHPYLLCGECDSPAEYTADTMVTTDYVCATHVPASLRPFIPPTTPADPKPSQFEPSGPALFHALLVILAVISAVAFFPAFNTVESIFSRPAPVSVQEDHPDFNCHVHGNRVCGPDAPADGYVNRGVGSPVQLPAMPGHLPL